MFFQTYKFSSEVQRKLQTLFLRGNISISLLCLRRSVIFNHNIYYFLGGQSTVSPPQLKLWGGHVPHMSYAPGRLIHLCASYASVKLPKSLEDLCRNIYSHFSTSAQRNEAFREFQDFFHFEKHNILRAGRTRWLSMKMSVDIILEQ